MYPGDLEIPSRSQNRSNLVSRGWSMAGTPPLPSAPLSQAALQAAGQEVHSSDKNTMRKNDRAAAPAQPPAEATGAALAPFTSVMVLGLTDPWEKGCFSRRPRRVPGTACGPYGMLRCREIVPRSWLCQEKGRYVAALVKKIK